MNIRWLGRIGYEEALTMQSDLVGKIAAGEEDECILLLEHEPVYTIGRTRDQSSLRSPESLPHPVIETNRGGQATYHGPGQLVGYPLLNLNHRGKDLHMYLRFLEGLLIRFCSKHGIAAERRDGLTGVWIGSRKIASLGVGVRKWVSMHGLAINILRDVSAFNHITPCGIQGVEITALNKEGDCDLSVQEAAEEVGALFRELMPETGEFPEI